MAERSEQETGPEYDCTYAEDKSIGTLQCHYTCDRLHEAVHELGDSDDKADSGIRDSAVLADRVQHDPVVGADAAVDAVEQAGCRCQGYELYRSVLFFHGSRIQNKYRFIKSCYPILP